MAGRARPSDVGAICGALPETWFGTSWGDVPTWLVGDQEVGDTKGRGFVLYRKPHKTAIDPATGSPFTDLLVIRTAGPLDKAALVESAEVIADAWRAVAPAKVRRRHPEF